MRLEMLPDESKFGWYSSDFHFRFEVTIREPYKAVILAHELAGLMDAAHEG